jgi:hypothetical protein
MKWLRILLIFSTTGFAASPEINIPVQKGPITLPQGASNRSIFLNGVDISSVKNQELKNVQSIRINERGDIYITDSHYTVVEEETYAPLSSREPAYPLRKPLQERKETDSQADQKLEEKLVPKAADATNQETKPSTTEPVEPAAKTIPKG